MHCRPAAADVGEHQAVHEVAIGLAATAVLDHVDLEEARRRVTPVGEGAHRHAAADGRAHTGSAPALPVDVQPRRGQRAVDGGGADLQEPVPDQGVQLQVTVALHGSDEHGDQRLEPLAADPVARLPQHDERLPDRLVVEPIAWPSARWLVVLAAQHTDRVLAVVARDRHELVQDLGPLTGGGTPVPCPHCFDQLPARCHAHSPRHVVLLLPAHPGGSKLREATGLARVAKRLSQCERPR